MGQDPSSAPRHHRACGYMSIFELTAQLLLTNTQHLVRSRRNKTASCLWTRKLVGLAKSLIREEATVMPAVLVAAQHITCTNRSSFLLQISRRFRETSDFRNWPSARDSCLFSSRMSSCPREKGDEDTPATAFGNASLWHLL